jgi:hypothetical protein
MRKLADGVYDDDNGGLHIRLGEFLAAHGYADTPENRTLLLDAWRQRCAAQGIELIEVDP